MSSANDQSPTIPNEALIKPLTDIKKAYVDTALAWYTKRAPRPRIAFRLFGTLAILISLSMPLLTLCGGEAGKWLIAVAAYLVAIFSALNGFFAFQSTWQKYITTQLILEALIAEWELEIADALQKNNANECWTAAYKATRKLIDGSRSVMTSEASKFFENIKLPKLDGSSK